MGLLANNYLGERGLFTYLSSRHGLLKNYVPFVTSPAVFSGFRTNIADKDALKTSRQILPTRVPSD